MESENLWITLYATGLQGGGELCVIVNAQITFEPSDLKGGLSHEP